MVHGVYTATVIVGGESLALLVVTKNRCVVCCQTAPFYRALQKFI